jgi:hypothetical protein
VVFHVDLVQLCRHSKEHSGPRPLFWNSRLIGIKGKLGGVMILVYIMISCGFSSTMKAL